MFIQNGAVENHNNVPKAMISLLVSIEITLLKTKIDGRIVAIKLIKDKILTIDFIFSPNSIFSE